MIIICWLRFYQAAYRYLRILIGLSYQYEYMPLCPKCQRNLLNILQIKFTGDQCQLESIEKKIGTVTWILIKSYITADNIFYLIPKIAVAGRFRQPFCFFRLICCWIFIRKRLFAESLAMKPPKILCGAVRTFLLFPQKFGIFAKYTVFYLTCFTFLGYNKSNLSI